MSFAFHLKYFVFPRRCRENSKMRHHFFQYMVEDRTESSMSYYEFLQFLQQKVKG